MSRLTESDIEDLALELLEGLDYDYQPGPELAHDGERPERSSYQEVLLVERVRAAIGRINPEMPREAQEEALRAVQRINSPDLLSNNEAFHRLLTEGVPVSYQKNGQSRGDRVWLVDFEEPGQNRFLAVNQFTVAGDHATKRPDIVLFVNGLPLVVIELKNATDPKADIRSAFDQIDTYKGMIPGLFTYNTFTVLSDGLEAQAGTVSSGFSRFMAWKSADGKTEAATTMPQLETLILGMLNPGTLLDLIRSFIVFEKTKK
ncbi:MAG: type I restriction endonuclease, partial [Bacteroidota bacterium]